MNGKSLYQRLVDLGVEVSGHESDLYFPATPATIQVIDDCLRDGVLKSRPTRFRSNVDHKAWFDAPFMYDPFWANHAPRS